MDRAGSKKITITSTNLPFDPGCASEPFLTLCAQAPGVEVYPFESFRTEWGPIFHRGRLDGSARILCIGQDPAEHEAVVRRILVGTAGHRSQGFLAKLGITRSYVMINTFLYSVYGQAAGQKHLKDASIIGYRNRWLSAITAQGNIEAVVAFGGFADQAWQSYIAVPSNASARLLPYQHVPHPTSPEGAGGTRAQIAAAMQAMLAAWNEAIVKLRPAISKPDTDVVLPPYGTALGAMDLVPIPSFDLPAGTPSWMSGGDGWAFRTGATAALKRRTIAVRVPDGIIK